MSLLGGRSYYGRDLAILRIIKKSVPFVHRYIILGEAGFDTSATHERELSDQKLTDLIQARARVLRWRCEMSTCTFVYRCGISGSGVYLYSCHQGESHKLRKARCLHFGHQVRTVKLHRARTNRQIMCNCLIRLPANQVLQNFVFAGAQ